MITDAYIRKDIIKFKIRYGKTVMGTILFTNNHTDEFETVSYQIS